MANGFSFRELEDGQVQLTAVPFSKEAVLGPQDVHELLHLLAHGEGGAFKMQTQQPAIIPSQPILAPQAATGTTTKIVRPSRREHPVMFPNQNAVSWLSGHYCSADAFPLVMASAPECCNMQGARHVGDARLPIIHHDRESPEQSPDANYPCTPVPLGVALELSTWKAHHEASSHLASARAEPNTSTKIAGTFHGTESCDFWTTAMTVNEMQIAARDV